MKKTIFYTAIAALAAGSIVTSCATKTDKVEDAQENVTEANQDLTKAQVELNAEYPVFKKDAEVQIAENDKRIAELRVQLNKPGKAPLDEMRKKRIDALNEKNSELRNRLYGYEKEPTDWEMFKQEFKHDMKGIGEAFKELGKKNTY